MFADDQSSGLGTGLEGNGRCDIEFWLFNVCGWRTLKEPRVVDDGCEGELVDQENGIELLGGLCF